jgi:hypothetical protein
LILSARSKAVNWFLPKKEDLLVRYPRKSKKKSTNFAKPCCEERSNTRDLISKSTRNAAETRQTSTGEARRGRGIAHSEEAFAAKRRGFFTQVKRFFARVRRSRKGDCASRRGFCSLAEIFFHTGEPDRCARPSRSFNIPRASGSEATRAFGAETG